MKDVTSTSFGLLAAFLLPGLIALFGFSMWSDSGHALLVGFEAAQSSIGLFFLVALAGLTLGLMLTPIRALLFEEWLLRKGKLEPASYAGLSTESKLVAFRAAVDETYRYHQFWGSAVITLPFAGAGYLWRSWATLSSAQALCAVVVVVLFEAACFWAAFQALKRYYERAKNILE